MEWGAENGDHGGASLSFRPATVEPAGPPDGSQRGDFLTISIDLILPGSPCRIVRFEFVLGRLQLLVALWAILSRLWFASWSSDRLSV